jgi:hypothetical protein
MKKKKIFDAVQMMREIRERHHKAYLANPEAREKRLEKIRKQYAKQIKYSRSTNI